LRPRVSKSRYGCKRRVGKSGEAVLGLSDKEAAYIELKMLTVGRSVEESVGWFVMAERVAEVHVKAPNARPISDEAAAAAASTLAPHPVGWRMFQWLQRSLVPDRSVVD